MSMVSFRCSDCEEWVEAPAQVNAWNNCSCQQLYVQTQASGYKVHGKYIGFWNPVKNLHYEYDLPRGY
jgi:hypothetical protein